MNEQLQQALAKLVEQTLQAAKTGAEFLGEEIPDVINQLLIWKAVESFTWFVVGIFTILSSKRVYNILLRKRKQAEIAYKNGESWTRFSPHTSVTSCSYDSVMCIPVPVSLLVFSTGMIAVITNLDWLKIILAPKLYLIEYAASLVK